LATLHDDDVERHGVERKSQIGFGLVRKKNGPETESRNFMRKTIPLALAALAATLIVPAQAQADFSIYAQEAGVNGGAITPIGTGADFTNTTFTGAYGDFTLTINGANSHNDPTLSSLLTATVSLKNNATSFRTISLFASQNNYSLPVGPTLQVESGLSGTVNTGTLTGAGQFQAFLDSTNLLLGVTDFSTGPQNVAFNGSTFGTGTASGTFNRPNPLFSITSRITGTLSGGGEGNFSSHVNVSAVSTVPEPASVFLTLVGCLSFAGAHWLRRRGATTLTPATS